MGGLPALAPAYHQPLAEVDKYYKTNDFLQMLMHPSPEALENK